MDNSLFSYPNLKACPPYNKDRKRYKECYKPISSMHCFEYCDLWSNKICGECVHWEPDEGVKGYSDKYGHCYWLTCHVHTYYKCTCPHYYKRPDDFTTYYHDWIEEQTSKEVKDWYSVEARPVRTKYYKQWGKLFR